MRTCESKRKKFRGGFSPILFSIKKDKLIFYLMGKFFRMKKEIFLKAYQPLPKETN